MINSKTQLNMVIGHPLLHSQSPLLHNTLYNLLDYNAIMLAHATQDLSTTIPALKTLGVGLIAVTMPYKEAILPYLDYVSQEVAEASAANTVILREGKLLGYNTDIAGVTFALRHISLTNKTVLMIGAGGAAHAAAYYLQKNNARLLWLNRTPQRALPLIEKFGGDFVTTENLNHLAIDVIINATPVGMFPEINRSPLPHYLFHAGQIVFDMLYNPANSLLLQTAQTHGATVISGLDMFIGQGLKQIELWLNTTVDIATIFEPVKNILIAAQREFA